MIRKLYEILDLIEVWEKRGLIAVGRYSGDGTQ
jgi:hypothetical protein